MKLYFAGTTSKQYREIIASLDGGMLLSYFYSHKKGLPSLKRKIFLDSGAYSAFSVKAVINIDDYIEFIKANKDKIETYANLDVIGDWQATEKNQIYMEGQGLNPLATFHYGSPLDVLREMIKKYDYIALGGLVPVAQDKRNLKKALDIYFNIIRDKCKVHAYGMNALWIWKDYPFYSVDATSWLVPLRYGQITRFEEGKSKTYQKKHKDVTSMRLALKDKNLIKEQAQELMKARDFITRLWEVRGIKWDK